MLEGRPLVPERVYIDTREGRSRGARVMEAIKICGDLTGDFSRGISLPGSGTDQTIVFLRQTQQETRPHRASSVQRVAWITATITNGNIDPDTIAVIDSRAPTYLMNNLFSQPPVTEESEGALETFTRNLEAAEAAKDNVTRINELTPPIEQLLELLDTLPRIPKPR